MSNFTDIHIDPGIIERATRGDPKAHEILYRAFSPPVYSICLRFTRVPAHAEDLLQETFIEVMRSIGQFRGEAPVGIWIRRVAVSKALMFLRSAWHARGHSLDDHWETGSEAGGQRIHCAERHEQAIDLDAAIGKLPPVARAVVWLHDVEGFTHKEIGQLMGKTESFSKSQLSRAYQRLRPLLQEHGGATNAALPASVLGNC